jgi:formate-dependent nitrite reductase membrane component NrfD
MVPAATPQSYYGHPVLKPPVWKPEVGVYLFTGGLAGGSAVLAATARAQGNDVLARRALGAALAGAAVSPPLLIKDLGVPRRFHHMLRVVKVTSPMNIGTWILSGVGAALGVATACETLGILPGLRRVAETGAAVLGPALSTYTAVLLSDTAVPAWHGAQLELPFVFAASSAATAGAAATLLTPPRHAQTARTLALGGVVAELAAAEVMKRRLGDAGEPYHRGEAGGFTRMATALGALGAGALALGGRRPPLALAGAAAVLAASFCERWSIFRAGTASASDPRYTVEPQRRATA